MIKVHIVKAMVFPVVMYECGCSKRRLSTEELTLSNCGAGEGSWDARRSNQSILKEINPEYSLEGLMLKLKLRYLVTWCEELTHWKIPWCWERLKAGGGDDRGWDGWMGSLTRWTWVWASSRSLSKLREAWRAAVHGVSESDTTEQLNWYWYWLALNSICQFLWCKYSHHGGRTLSSQWNWTQNWEEMSSTGSISQ